MCSCLEPSLHPYCFHFNLGSYPGAYSAVVPPCTSVIQSFPPRPDNPVLGHRQGLSTGRHALCLSLPGFRDSDWVSSASACRLPTSIIHSIFFTGPPWASRATTSFAPSITPQRKALFRCENFKNGLKRADLMVLECSCSVALKCLHRVSQI